MDSNSGHHSLVYRLEGPRYGKVILQLDSYDLVREGFEESRVQFGQLAVNYRYDPQIASSGARSEGKLTRR